jgi:hypothetical protein
MGHLALFTVLLTVVGFCVPPASAQVLQHPSATPTFKADSSVSRIAFLESKVANLETTLKDRQGCDQTSAPSCCIRRARCHTGGIIGGYDFVWLKPHFSNSRTYTVFEEGGANDHQIYGSFSTTYELAPRFWLGYQWRSGVGARIRYWQFDHNLMNETHTSDATYTYYYKSLTASGGESLTFTNGMEMHVMDIEFFQDMQWWNTQLTVGGGLRYGKVLFDGVAHEYSAASTLLQTERDQTTFEGIGPTVFIDFERPIRSSAFSIVGGLRGSVLFGRGWKESCLANEVSPASITYLQKGNRTTSVLEATFGVQYDRAMTRGTDMFVRLAWEGQTWCDIGSPTSGASVSASYEATSTDMGLEGISLCFGISR